ncbi:MAG TPA: hypothetical protein VF974_07685 [Patescibacteria group bacterium]
MNAIEEISVIDKKLIDLRQRYLLATPNKRKFIAVLGKALKDKQKRLRDSLGSQMQLEIAP